MEGDVLLVVVGKRRLKIKTPGLIDKKRPGDCF